MATEENTNPTFLRLPSIYKPFYIQRLYTISGQIVSYMANVYNGIGLLASTKFLTMDDFKNNPQILDKIDGFDKIERLDSLIGKYENSTAPKKTKNNFGNNNVNEVLINRYKNAKYETLKSILYNYLGDDSQLFFAGLPTGTTTGITIENNDLYAIGLLNDKINGLSFTSPIYRNKPLILSDYNDSVKDICMVIRGENDPNIRKVELANYFHSVSFVHHQGHTVNRNQSNILKIDFGDLDDKNKNGEYIVKIRADIAQNEDGSYCFTLTGGTYDDNSDTTRYLRESIEIIGHLNETINNKGVRYYIVNYAFIDEFFYYKENLHFTHYKYDYLKNRELYDIKQKTYNYNEDDDDIDGGGFPFLNMIPSLKNSYGYYYSNSGYTNLNVPCAMEVYCEKIDEPEGSTEYERHFNLKINSNFATPPTETTDMFYLIGVYSPLTVLNGSCCEYKGGDKTKDTPYVREIQGGTELIPQIDSTTIMMNFGCVYPVD